MKTPGWTRFLALCLAVISLSMLVSGGLGIRAANKERRKDESELQDLRGRIDEYREVSAALMDRVSYEELNRALEEKQKKYDADMAKHRAELSTYTAANGGLEMGNAALNQAESALETGKTQYEMGKKALNRSRNAIGRFSSMIDPAKVAQTQKAMGAMFTVAEKLLSDGDPDSGDPGGSVYQLERAIERLCALMENELPGEESSAGDDQQGKDATNPEDPAPEDPEDPEEPENPEDPETPEDSEDPEDPEDPENPEEPENPKDPEDPDDPEPDPDDPEPQDPEPEPEEPDPADEPPPAGENPAPEVPRSPDTGEEQDPSGRLNDAIRDVIQAAAVVAADAAKIAEQAESIELPTDITRTVLNSAGVQNTEELRTLIIETIHESGIVLTPEQGEALGQMLQILESADGMTENVANQLRAVSETADAAEDETEELLRRLRTDVGLTEETLDDDASTEKLIEEIRAAYRNDLVKGKEALESVADALHLIDDKRKEYYGTVLEAHRQVNRVFSLVEQLSGAKAKLDETWDAMKEMGAQIEEGEAVLAEGRAQLDAAKDEQKKKAEELDRKKRDLDAQEKALKQSAEEAEAQKDLEEREKTLRAALLSREEIRRRGLEGEDLLPASERWLTEYTEQTARRWRDRFNASLMMIAAAVLALAGALTAFGESRYRIVTLLLTLLCLALSAAAAYLLWRMGRGISWSAAVTALIAAAELLFLIPSLFRHRAE